MLGAYNLQYIFVYHSYFLLLKDHSDIIVDRSKITENLEASHYIQYNLSCRDESISKQ